MDAWQTRRGVEAMDAICRLPMAIEELTKEVKTLKEKSNPLTLFVKTTDKCPSYGAEIYLVGVYDSREKAENDGQPGFITEVALNKTYNGENYLGGFAE